MITQPTSAALARPPRKIIETTLGLTRSAGKPTILSAVNGRPPMAKMSESELAAADLAVRKGVVHDRREKINRLYQGAMPIQAIHAGVIKRFRAHQHVAI